MTVALVFPGQGSQSEGMARPWREQPSFGLWARADEALGWDVTRLGIDAPADELRQPANCQMALFVHGAVLLSAWREAGGAEPAAVAGHSLGEYNALLAASVVNFADGLRLVAARAQHTQAAAEENPGTMVACLGYEVDVVREACERAGAFVANDNAPGQIVAAGSAEALAELRDVLAEREERGKVVSVNVGAAYHSPHMQPAVAPFGHELDATGFGNAMVPVVANVDGDAHTTAADWPSLLREQIVAPVRWRETVATLARLGVDDVVELGASPVLTALVKRTDRSLGRRHVAEPDDLAAAISP